MLENVTGLSWKSRFAKRKRVQVLPDLGYETRKTSSGKDGHSTASNLASGENAASRCQRAQHCSNGFPERFHASLAARDFAIGYHFTLHPGTSPAGRESTSSSSFAPKCPTPEARPAPECPTQACGVHQARYPYLYQKLVQARRNEPAVHEQKKNRYHRGA